MKEIIVLPYSPAIIETMARKAIPIAKVHPRARPTVMGESWLFMGLGYQIVGGEGERVERRREVREGKEGKEEKERKEGIS